jgi:hypothetical protein
LGPWSAPKLRGQMAEVNPPRLKTVEVFYFFLLTSNLRPQL